MKSSHPHPAGLLVLLSAGILLAAGCDDPDAVGDTEFAEDDLATDDDEVWPRGSCGDSFHPSVGGGEAYWTLLCHDGHIRMKGWVKDTRADGKCARVKAVFNNNVVHQSSGACPKGTIVQFDWKHPGTIADGYLTVT